MAWYEYVCPSCGLEAESQEFAKIGQAHPRLITCSLAGGTCTGMDFFLVRKVSMPQTRPTAEPYYNHSINAWVKDDADFKRHLARKSRENEELTGTAHNFQPVYPGDLTDPGTMKKLGVGLDGGYAIEHSQRNNPDARPKPSNRKIIV